MKKLGLSVLLVIFLGFAVGGCGPTLPPSSAPETPTPAALATATPDSIATPTRHPPMKRSVSIGRWTFEYPASWDRLNLEPNYVQETATGKFVEFRSEPTSKSDLESWIESEIARKLAPGDAENTLVEPLVVSQKGELTVYRYTVRSRICESCDTLLKTTVFFDGTRRYEFYTAIPPVTEEEYEAILDSFRSADG